MSKVVCLDSQVIIWGIKRQAEHDQSDMIAIATDFIKHLSDEEYEVIVPSPVLSELMVRMPLDKHAAFVDYMQSNFMIAPFDALAAVKCAEMMAAYRSDEELKQYREENKITNATIKYDYQIAAIACVGNCECIYSYDKGLKNFASGHIEVRQIPRSLGSQASIFG